jgi:hypothetical protein
MLFFRWRGGAKLLSWLICCGSLSACGSVDSGGSRPQSTGGGGSAGVGGTISLGGSSGSAAGTQQTGGTVVIGPGADGGSGGPGCQNLHVEFQPKTPTIFALVDRSGSMFDSMVWDPLRLGALDVIMSMQSQVRFGFAAFTSYNGMCPVLNPVPIALDNYAAIATLYNGLGNPNVKADTPTVLALQYAQMQLQNDTGNGGKYILLVTDGDPDYCDDINPICAVDSVVHELQTLSAAGITTFVLGIKTPTSSISDEALLAFANAGASQPVPPPLMGTVNRSAPLMIWDQCNGQAKWAAELTAAQKAMTSLGTYAAAAGTAKAYTPDATNQAALRDQIAQLVSGIKSCVFDLSGQIEVDLNQINLAQVSVQGQPVPLDTANGWRMNTSTQLELVGSACANWRKPETTTIDFNFPCGIIIIK